ncbi:MAG: phosphoribosylglycinamide formyltransferase [Melioribacteraceae bacterium]|nr:MAG: phosphoribosylglycinamide formyltransferase [Melioribacteraceae bacterium]
MYKIAVFVSGRGSNLKAILNSFPPGNRTVEVSAIISNKSDCPAVEIAVENKIPYYFVSLKEKQGYVSHVELADKLKASGVSLIVLAGYLKKIPENFIDQFDKKIINIHPALLPSFGGKGMYGMNVHKAVFEKSCMVSGPTVHFVDKIYDNGIIIAQRSADISKVKSPEEIASAVLKLEHELLPFVVGKFAENKISLENNRVYIKD